MHKIRKPHTVPILAALILLIFIAFEPVRHNDFVDYDDVDYITKNRHIESGFTWSGVLWAFTTGYVSNWHPLTWLSHMLDVELFGLNPVWHHLHNVLLHIAASALLFLILRKMLKSMWQSVFIALAFGLHPLRVESVAWAAERKDVLSVLFFMLTLMAYLYYIQQRGFRRYLLVVLCLGLGLMAKPMLVTVPLILLLLDWWPLRRIRNFLSMRSLITEKIPLFLLTLASCIITFLVQQAAGSVWAIPFLTRLLNALTSYTAYLTKLFCPVDLAVIYPYPANDLPIGPSIMSLFILLFWTGLFVYQRSKRPYLLMGWLWYIVTLIPVIGLIQVGSQAMADRYTYLPSIGIFLIITCAAAELTAHWRYQKTVLGFLGGLAVLGMILATRTQVACWKNSIVLYQNTLSVTSNNYIAESNLSQALMEQNRFSEAAPHIARALELRPDSPHDAANMALLWMLQDQPEKALEYVYQALSRKHDSAKAYYNCGLIFEKLERVSEALEAYEQAVLYKPDYSTALCRIGVLKEKQGLLNEAAGFYRQTIHSDPRYAEGYKNLAWLLATSPAFKGYDPAEAIQSAQKACEITLFKNPEMVDVLAAAYASAGQFEEAVKTAQKAIDLANAAGRTDRAAEIAERQKLYQNRLPFRKPSPARE